jgi:DNA-binding response OmpR family regulator
MTHQSHENRILLVEDEALIALAESEMLRRNGFEVVHAASGEAALQILESNHEIGLILMDINLGPGMSGPDTAKEIIRTRQIPVLFLSSHIEPDVVAMTENISSYGYVVKNSGETVLLASIRMARRLHRAHLELQSSREELEATNEELEAAFEEMQLTNEELIRSQTELSELESRYHSLYNAMDEGVALHTIIRNDVGIATDYIINDVNPRFEALTGISRADIIGKRATLAYGLDAAPYLDIYARVAETGEPFRFETWHEPLRKHYLISVSSRKKTCLPQCSATSPPRHAPCTNCVKKPPSSNIISMPVWIFCVSPTRKGAF